MQTDSPTCLVTGAQGFLGRHIVAELARAGFRVVGIDRSADAPPLPGLADYVAAALPDPALDELLRRERPYAVVHTAGPASVGDSITHPAQDFHGSVGMLVEVLDAVRREAPEARFVSLSSAAVYGDPSVLPVGEDAPVAPVSPYGFHKLQCEGVLREYHAVYGTRTAAVRIFSAYGKGLRRQLLWDVCEKAAAGSVSLFGTGAESRDFIHAADVASGVRVVLENAPLAGEVYNLASGTETTVREIADRLIDCVAPGAPVAFSGAAREGDPLRWRADITRISALGFRPSVDLAAGLRDYCDWYLAERKRS